MVGSWGGRVSASETAPGATHAGDCQPVREASGVSRRQADATIGSTDRRKSMAGSVGFIGLGNMGGPMALNLVEAGFELVVHDINPARLVPLVAAGATVETSPEAVAARCHRTICMVETTAQADA